jgi:hypothetical protein
VRIFYRESCITPKIEANRLKFNRTAENQWFGQHKYDLRKLNLPGKVKKGQASPLLLNLLFEVP